MTCSFASLGQNQLRGYQMCVKRANDKGGILVRKIELITEDDKSDPATAVNIYERDLVIVMTQAIVRALLTSGETDHVRFLSNLNQALFGNVQRMGGGKNLTLVVLKQRQPTASST